MKSRNQVTQRVSHIYVNFKATNQSLQSHFIPTSAIADIKAMDSARWTVQQFAYGK
jgi:hypothetical protein